MRIILDENLPRLLNGIFPNHDVTTVQEQGLAGTVNGALRAALEGVFDVLPPDFTRGAVPGLGARFCAGVESVCAAIVRQPLLWRERRGGYHRVNIPRFPYYVAY